MGLRTRIKQRGKRVAKRVLRRFQGDASDISKPVHVHAPTPPEQQTKEMLDADVQRLAEELDASTAPVQDASELPQNSVAFQIDLPPADPEPTVVPKDFTEEDAVLEAGPTDSTSDSASPEAAPEESSTAERDWPPLLDDAEADSIRNDVIEQIQTIFDPEIPVNIYELGLIYEVNVHENKAVNVIMTLTSPNCPAAQSLPNEVKVKTEDLEAVTEAAVDVVWEPVWGPHLMTEAARLELNL